MDKPVDALWIAQRVFRALKSRLPDARLIPHGSKNGHRYYAINDRVNGDLISLQIGKEDNHWQCHIAKTDLSKMPPNGRIKNLPKELGEFVDKNNLLGWERTESGVK